MEWRVIPDYPKYEITKDGAVRLKKKPHKTIMNQYTGGKFMDDCYSAVILGAYSYKMLKVADLVEQAFPSV